jgi:hypothetical protein
MIGVAKIIPSKKLTIVLSIKASDPNYEKGGGFFRGWRAERVLGAGICIFQFVSLRAWIVNIMLLKIPLSCFYQTVFLVYILFCFSCLDVISLIYGFLRW